MRVAFSPALGDTVHVSANGTRQTSIQLHFTARMLSLADYEQVATGRIKLQLWSDIPSTGDSSSNDWSEAEFRPVQSMSPGEFSLLTGQQRDEIRTTLTLAISVPLSAQRFSFTYRLVYPTGEIKWLGQYGQNGTLLLDRIDSDRILLGEGWVPADNGAYRRDSDGRAVQDLEVATLSNADYTAYAVQEKRFVVRVASVFVLIDHPAVFWIPKTLLSLS
jgi:hypothetical protein